MRQQIKLEDLKVEYKKSFKKISKDSRYDGLKDCRKNVVKCNVSGKLKYCIPTGGI